MGRRFMVVCEWSDSQDNDHMDSDEIQVWAESAAGAVQKAMKKWRLTIGAEWPQCRLTRSWAMTPRRRRLFTLGGDAYPHRSTT